MNEQAQEARADLLEALQNKEFEAMVDRGPLVPIEYWRTNGAATTVHTGALSLGPATKPEDQKWQHYRVLLKAAKFEAWLKDSFPDSTITKRSRHRDIDANAILGNNIATGVQAARRLWPDDALCLGRNEMARELAGHPSLRDIGYGEQTIRKILNGSYGPSRRLDIQGLPGVDPRAT